MDSSKGLITNPTFMWGFDHGWQPLCCSLCIRDTPPLCGPPPSGHQFYCVAHSRTQAWQGIAQDLSGKLKVMISTLSPLSPLSLFFFSIVLILLMLWSL